MKQRVRKNRREVLVLDLDDLFMHATKRMIGEIIGEAVERPLIETALERSAGNCLHAAKLLGMSRVTLQTKMRALGIHTEQWQKA